MSSVRRSSTVTLEFLTKCGVITFILTPEADSINFVHRNRHESTLRCFRESIVSDRKQRRNECHLIFVYPGKNKMYYHFQLKN